MKFLFLVLVVLSSSRAWSRGDELLNGGDILVCKKNGATTYELYDFSEARSAYNLTLVQNPAQKSMKDVFEETLQRLEKFNPTRAGLYRKYFESFPVQSRFAPKESFGNVPDEGWRVLPAGCHLEQGVVQFREANPQGLRYFINESLWNKLSAFDQAGLLMHEFIYREVTSDDANVSNSLRVRYFNEVLHSTSLETMSLNDYLLKLLKYVGFQKADLGGQVILLQFPLVMNAAGEITEATIENRVQVIYDGQIQILSCASSNSSKNMVAHFSQQKLTTIDVPCLMYFTFDTKDVTGYSLVHQLSFDDEGHLQSLAATIQNGEYIDALRFKSSRVDISSNLVVLSNPLIVNFWPDGPVQEIHLGPKGVRGTVLKENNMPYMLTGRIGEKILYFNQDGSFSHLSEL